MNKDGLNEAITIGALVWMGTYMTWRVMWLSTLLTAVILFAVMAYRAGWFANTGKIHQMIRRVLAQLAALRVQQVGEDGGYLLRVGKDTATGEDILFDLDSVGSMGVFAQTGSGKSTLVENLLCELVTRYPPSELRLFINDPSGVDYRIWRRLSHLAHPITDTGEAEQMLIRLQQERDRRARLYDRMPADRKCNSLHLYHALIDELGLNSPRLPMILLILDEVQDVTIPKSVAETIIRDLVKTGRKFGIFVWAITQRNTVENLSRDIQDQFKTRLVGAMDSAQSYANIGRVPKDVYEQMKPRPGRFMVKYLGRWGILDGYKKPDAKIEQIARARSGEREPDAPQDVAPAPEKQTWVGLSNDQKRDAVLAWLDGFDEKPHPTDFTDYFDASYNTGRTWIDRYWK